MGCALLAFWTVKCAQILRAAKGAKLIITLMPITHAHHAQQTVLFVALPAAMNALLGSTLTTVCALLVLLIV